MSRPPAFDWTDERVATLKRMWAEGVTAEAIAASLGGGITRNAVIGKVHRMRLPRDQDRPRRAPRPYGPRLKLTPEERKARRAAYMREYNTDPLILAERAERKRRLKRLAAQRRREAARVALGLPPGPVRRPKKTTASKPAAPPQQPVRIPLPAPEPVLGGTVRFLDRRVDADCAWPAWDDPLPRIEERMVCGRPAVEGRGQPLCAWHWFIGHGKGTEPERGATIVSADAAHA